MLYELKYSHINDLKFPFCHPYANVLPHTAPNTDANTIGLSPLVLLYIAPVAAPNNAHLASSPTPYSSSIKKKFRDFPISK